MIDVPNKSKKPLKTKYMNTEDNHPLRFDDIPAVLGWIKRKLVELDAKIDVIQGKKELAVEEDR